MALPSAFRQGALGHIARVGVHRLGFQLMMRLFSFERLSQASHLVLGRLGRQNLGNKMFAGLGLLS